MRIDVVELRRLSMPLVTPFRTSFGAQTFRDVLLVRVVGPDGEGWGECVAMNEPHYSAEYAGGAHAVTREHLLPLIAAAGEVTASRVRPVLAPVKGHPMAKAAIEMAVLDAELSARSMSLGAYLGAVHTSVACGVSVGIPAAVGELLDTVGRHIEEGYARIKLKIEPGWDVEPVRAVRQRFGDDVALQVDANAAYTLADARHLRRLDPFGLILIEQPLPEDDVAGHATLSRMIDTPICLDESITGAAAAADAINRGACSVVNVKAGRVGGYLEARRVHDVCAAQGVAVWCGGMLETGLGRAANLALAALPGFVLPGDISASERYWEQDITTPFRVEAGRMAVPSGPGIGVRPDRDVLDAYTTFVEEIPLRTA